MRGSELSGQWVNWGETTVSSAPQRGSPFGRRRQALPSPESTMPAFSLRRKAAISRSRSHLHVREVTIDIAAMSYPNDENEERIVFDVVNYPVVSFMKPVKRFRIDQLLIPSCVQVCAEGAKIPLCPPLQKAEAKQVASHPPFLNGGRGDFTILNATQHYNQRAVDRLQVFLSYRKSSAGYFAEVWRVA